MPILYVSGIRSDIKEEKLVNFWESLRHCVAGIPELGIVMEQVTVFFPSDMLQEGWVKKLSSRSRAFLTSRSEPKRLETGYARDWVKWQPIFFQRPG